MTDRAAALGPSRHRALRDVPDRGRPYLRHVRAAEILGGAVRTAGACRSWSRIRASPTSTARIRQPRCAGAPFWMGVRGQDDGAMDGDAGGRGAGRAGADAAAGAGQPVSARDRAACRSLAIRSMPISRCLRQSGQGRRRARARRHRPALGADTDAVLAQAGYGSGEIAQLRAAGVIWIGCSSRNDQ